MSYKYMRVLIMFDLPVKTSADRKEYNRFRKVLIKSGFMMMQKSIYCKLAPNGISADSMISFVRRQVPAKGVVQALKITEKQFAKIEYMIGTANSEVINSDERLIFL